MNLVSVIITTCNRPPKMLKEAIDSVLGQTYSEIELIVVNDAPNYENREAVESMINEYGDKINYIVNHEQKGANYARNLGAKTSKGTILSFLDDDDFWHKNRIQRVVDKIEDGYDVIYSDYEIFSEKHSHVNTRYSVNEDEKLQKILSANFLGGFSNVSFTKELFMKVGMLDEKMPSYQDQDLFIRLVQNGKLGYINDTLSYYRITPVSISLNGNRKLSGMKLLLEKYDDLFKKYPDSKRRRLESELSYALKNGWYSNASEIKKNLKEFDSPMKIANIEIKGFFKHIAIKYLKLQ